MGRNNHNAGLHMIRNNNFSAYDDLYYYNHQEYDKDDPFYFTYKPPKPKPKQKIDNGKIIYIKSPSCIGSKNNKKKKEEETPKQKRGSLDPPPKRKHKEKIPVRFSALLHDSECPFCHNTMQYRKIVDMKDMFCFECKKCRAYFFKPKDLRRLYNKAKSQNREINWLRVYEYKGNVLS